MFDMAEAAVVEEMLQVFVGLAESLDVTEES